MIFFCRLVSNPFASLLLLYYAVLASTQAAAAVDTKETTSIQQKTPAQIFNTISQHHNFPRQLQISQCDIETAALPYDVIYPQMTEEDDARLKCAISSDFTQCNMAVLSDFNARVIAACIAAGGQNVEISMGFSLGGMSYRYNNFSVCVGASCDPEEVKASFFGPMFASFALGMNFTIEVEDPGVDTYTSSSSKATAAFSALAVAGAYFMA